MIKSFTVKGYKKLNHFMLSDLSRINLITGETDLGKSCILESMFAFCSGNDVNMLIRGSSYRISRYDLNALDFSYSDMLYLLYSFSKRDSMPLTMSFCATYDDDNKTREFKHSVVFTDLINKICDFDVAKDELQQFFDTYNETLETDISDESFKRNLAFDPVLAHWTVEDSNADICSYPITRFNTDTSDATHPVAVSYIDILQHTFLIPFVNLIKSLQKNDLLDSVVAVLKVIFPYLDTIKLIKMPDGKIYPFVIDVNGEVRPIFSFGECLQRCFYILGSVFAYPDGLLLLNDADYGIDFRVQQGFFKLLLKYARQNNTQIFMVSNNLGFMDHLILSSQEDSALAELRVITIKNLNNNVLCHRILSGSDAYKARFGFEMDLR